MGPISIKYLDKCYNDKIFKKYERDETLILKINLFYK